MKMVRWMRFTWELAKVPDAEHSIGSQYLIRPAAKEDFQALLSVVLSAFYLDPSWNECSDRLNTLFQKRFEELSEDGPLRALVLVHGKRVVGGTVYRCDAEAANHLLTGPCLLQEYSNRGLGSALLHQSLLALKQAGLQSAHGVTKTGTTSAKFVYSKFHSTSLAYDPEPNG